jgi:hypothetical protein
MLLFETMLPARYYLPRADILAERINVVLDGKRLERPITPWSAGPEA